MAKEVKVCVNIATSSYLFLPLFYLCNEYLNETKHLQLKPQLKTKQNRYYLPGRRGDPRTGRQDARRPQDVIPRQVPHPLARAREARGGLQGPRGARRRREAAHDRLEQLHDRGLRGACPAHSHQGTSGILWSVLQYAFLSMFVVWYAFVRVNETHGSS